MRTCHCTGYLRNPGGKCCMDLSASQQPRIGGPGTARLLPLTEEQVRQIIREEIRRANADR